MSQPAFTWWVSPLRLADEALLLLLRKNPVMVPPDSQIIPALPIAARKAKALSLLSMIGEIRTGPPTSQFLLCF
jgi:hypothetical protein